MHIHWAEGLTIDFTGDFLTTGKDVVVFMAVSSVPGMVPRT